MIVFRSSTAVIAGDGAVVVALFDGEPEPVVIFKGSVEGALNLVSNIARALAEADNLNGGGN